MITQRGRPRRSGPAPSQARPNLTESAYKAVVQKSIPVQIRQLILHVGNNEG